MASVLVCLAMSIQAFIRARSKGHYYSLSTIFVGAALYSAFYAAELLQPDLAGVLRCVGFEYLGVQVIIVSMFFMIQDFRGKPNPAPGTVALASIVPAITLIIAFTSPYHELLYIEPAVTMIRGFTILSFSRGPWYWINIMALYGVFGFGLIAFIRTIRTGTGVRRAQALYLLVGSSAPFVFNVVYLAGLTPAGTELSPIAFVLSGMLFSAGFFRYRVFDMQPIARDTVFEHMKSAAIVVGDDESIVDCNTAARTLFPQLSSSSRNPRFSELCDDCPALQEALSSKENTRTIALPSSGGEKLKFELHRSFMTDKGNGNIGVLFILYDVTDRELLQDQLRDLASIDGLTGVSNRRSFYEKAGVELDRARRHGRPIGFAIMDMNGFKQINDRYGHQAGDDALKLTARLCVDTLRSCDVVGRIGGDEFAFIFPECDEAGTAAAVEKVRKVVCAATFSSGVETVRLSAAFGSTGSGGPVHPDLEEFLSIADRRMYIDKPRLRSVKAASKPRPVQHKG
jgi:diguanylate cyclase (GGDEF)-like protein